MSRTLKRPVPIVAALCLFFLFGLLIASSFAFSGPEARSKAWQGVDEAVVGRIAREQGREPRPPLVRTDMGDLPLFAFLAAGAMGGFAAGYWWRVLLERRKK
jgi:cobalt/nickel transport system permease protein